MVLETTQGLRGIEKVDPPSLRRRESHKPKREVHNDSSLEVSLHRSLAHLTQQDELGPSSPTCTDGRKRATFCVGIDPPLLEEGLPTHLSHCSSPRHIFCCEVSPRGRCKPKLAGLCPSVRNQLATDPLLRPLSAVVMDADQID